MGLFGLFDKKSCDICGEDIGLLGNRKLEDGNMCKDCAKLLSPLFDERRHSTIEQISAQLAYRKQNEEALRNFQPTRSLGREGEIKVDERNGTFVYCRHDDWRERNPDIISFSQVTSCNMDIREDEEQIYREDEDGRRESYSPPRFKTEYDFRMEIRLDSPWFDEINFRLNDSFDDIDSRYSPIFQRYEQMGYEICSILGSGGRMQGGYPQQQGGYPPQQGGYPPQQTAPMAGMGGVCPACQASTSPDPSGKCPFCGGMM